MIFKVVSFLTFHHRNPVCIFFSAIRATCLSDLPSLTLPPECNLVVCTKHEAPHYPVFSSLLLTPPPALYGHRMFITTFTGALPSPCKMLRNVVNDYAEEQPAPHPTLKMEGHPLSYVRACFSIYTQLPSISAGRSSIRNLRTRHADQASCHIQCKVIKLSRG